MARKKRNSEKQQFLQNYGCLNPHPDSVKNELFWRIDFFDPHDLVQVKYEMLRSVLKDRQTVTEAARTFGFSRPTFYQVQASFENKGLPGLLSQRRGPQRPHKLTESVLQYLEVALAEHPFLKSKELAELVKAEFGLVIHPRTLEKGLQARKKNGK